MKKSFVFKNLNTSFLEYLLLNNPEEKIEIFKKNPEALKEFIFELITEKKIFIQRIKVLGKYYLYLPKEEFFLFFDDEVFFEIRD